MFTLVRHAHAGDKRRWKRPDAERPLSQRGWQQAVGLAKNLSGMQGARLLSGSSLRCHQTLSPLSDLLGRPIEDCDLLGPDADSFGLDHLLTDPAMDGAVLCTHGETLNALMNRWRDQLSFEDSAGRDAAARGTTEKGAAWLIVTDEGGIRAHYLRPLLIGDEVRSEDWAGPGQR